MRNISFLRKISASCGGKLSLSYLLEAGFLGNLLVLLVLISFNFFFSMAEIAVISLGESRLRRISKSNIAKAKNLVSIAKNPTGFLSTIQLGITLSGFFSSAVAAAGFSEKIVNWAVNAGINVSRQILGAVSLIVITLALSFLTLVLGELVPKRIGMHNPEKIALAVSGIIRFISKLFLPFVWLLTVSTNGILRLLRINPHGKSQEVTEEEIRMLISVGEEKGAIEESEKEMIENIFDLNNISASDCMVHRTDIAGLRIGEPAEKTGKTILSNTHSRFPVYKDDLDNISGILNTHDYLLNIILKTGNPLEKLLRPAYFVPESIRADLLLKNMRQKHIQMAIVVDEYGGTSGLVTIEDIVEKIVGAINDEYDPPQQDIELIEGNIWRINGDTGPGEVNHALGLNLPEDKYDTFGGYILSRFNEIPPDGSRPEMQKDGFIIEVERIEDHRVKSCIVTKTNRDNPEE
jgi:putative hemolysin